MLRRLLNGLVLVALLMILSPTTVPVARADAPPVYSASVIDWGPNCGLTQIIIYLRDASGAFLNGERFRIETADGSWGAISFPTGSWSYPPGTTDFVLRTEPIGMLWNIWPVDASGNKIGAPYQVVTDTNDCKPGGWGHQVAWIQFIRGVAPPSAETTPAVGAPQATPTPSPFPWQPAGLTWLPNCGLTQVIIFARDQQGRLVNGARFRIESATGNWFADSTPTGEQGQPPGRVDFPLRGAAFANDWNLYAIDDAGNRISPVMRISTDDRDCAPTGTGHQVAITQFVRQ